MAEDIRNGSSLSRLANDEPDPLTYAIIGAAMEVHSTLGAGYLEVVYGDALAFELQLRGIAFEREVAIPVLYKGHQLTGTFRIDFVCEGRVLLEIKAIPQLGKVEEAQILHYLKASSFTLGLLVNFGADRLQFRRFVR